jgi:cell wall-associated NlpC family hydrolase
MTLRKTTFLLTSVSAVFALILSVYTVHAQPLRSYPSTSSNNTAEISWSNNGNGNTNANPVTTAINAPVNPATAVSNNSVIIPGFNAPVSNEAPTTTRTTAIHEKTGAVKTPDVLGKFLTTISNTSSATLNVASNAAGSVFSAAQTLVGNALGLLGVPYRYGGNTAAQGLDCSGFVKLVFAQTLGIILPRRADEMGKLGRYVPDGELKPGDLVFFNTMHRINSHVGIYIGEGEFVHSPSTGGRIRVDKLRGSYWNQHFEGGKRITDLNQ